MKISLLEANQILRVSSWQGYLYISLWQKGSLPEEMFRVPDDMFRVPEPKIPLRREGNRNTEILAGELFREPIKAERVTEELPPVGGQEIACWEPVTIGLVPE